MARPAVPPLPEDAPSFRDGLGDRRPIADGAGLPRELLSIREELTTVPSFEFALRERFVRLAEFRHPHFVPARAVERLRGADESLGLVSDRIDGIRLSVLFAEAAARGLNLDIDAALGLMRQIVQAVARLHESWRDVSHGALGPERVVLTPDGRLMITEYVLGAALEQLHYSQERYWQDLRLALPRSTGLPRFDQRADVLQIGLIGLSLVLGRPLREAEYPSRISELLRTAHIIVPRGGFEPLPPALRTWLTHALQLDVRHPFASAVEASDPLERAIAETRHPGLPASVEGFLARFRERAIQASSTAGPVSADGDLAGLGEFKSEREIDRTPPRDDEPLATALDDFASEVEPAAVPLPAPTSARAAAGVTVRALAAPRPTAVPPSTRPRPERRQRDLFTSAPVPSRARWVAGLAAVVTAAVALGGGGVAGRVRSAAAPATGTLVITTVPAGAMALLDGRPIGLTPTTLTVEAGAHMLELRGTAGPMKTVPVVMAGGARLEQYIELPGGPLAGILPDQDETRTTAEVLSPAAAAPPP